ncbi:MAG: hypothetical protein COA47_12830 [Robiginitomaculum sp.]|nr:MAG: hypothetical protein COA47_12830 [Robiginitomaculum sp.]
MCGELDENLEVNKEILDRFSILSNMLGAVLGEKPAPHQQDLSTAEGRSELMDVIFHENLGRTLTTVSNTAEDEIVDSIASHAIALARLAGFIAGQLPPDADLFRSVIDAMSAGHAETTQLANRYGKARAEHHDHDH